MHPHTAPLHSHSTTGGSFTTTNPWIPTCAFARVAGFPDSFQLYHDPSDAIDALAHSTSPVTAALTISIALLLIGINLFSSPTSPLLQIILQAIPDQTVPDISLRCQLHIIGTAEELAQLILRSTESLAIEIALTFAVHGITSLNTLVHQGSQPGFNLTIPSHLQHHIHLILSQANTSPSISTSPDNHYIPNIHLPAHLRQTLLALRQPQQTLFLQYISPLLSPLHSLLQNIPHAYLNTISLHLHTALDEQTSILTTALNIAAIQDTAARIILFLIPPFVPIEILHRSLCVALLKNTSPGSFRTVHTSCIITRSLLGRF